MAPDEAFEEPIPVRPNCNRFGGVSAGPRATVVRAVPEALKGPRRSHNRCQEISCPFWRRRYMSVRPSSLESSCATKAKSYPRPDLFSAHGRAVARNDRSGVEVVRCNALRGVIPRGKSARQAEGPLGWQVGPQPPCGDRSSAGRGMARFGRRIRRDWRLGGMGCSVADGARLVGEARS